MTGNLLSAIQCRLADVEFVTITDVQSAFDSGKLTPLLPDEHWWLAHADESDDVLSLEAIPTADVADHSPQPTSRDGGLIVLQSIEGNDLPNVQMSFFPACDAADQFKGMPQ